jgi:hypothetical protein
MPSDQQKPRVLARFIFLTYFAEREILQNRFRDFASVSEMKPAVQGKPAPAVQRKRGRKAL